MDRQVYLIANGDEFHIGSVAQILEGRGQVDRAKTLLQAIRESIEEIMYEDGDEEEMLFSISLR
jgi:hypothetical protein